MSKEQIEEMAKETMKHCEIGNQCGSCHWSTCNECLAEVLYSAGYRKQSEVAREILGEIEKEIKQSLAEHNNKKMQYNIDDALFHLYHGITASQMGMLDFIAELKKKYTEG